MDKFPPAEKASDEAGQILPCMHRMNLIERWKMLPVQDIHSIECDIRYQDGAFYLGHDKDEVSREATFHSILWDVIARMPRYFSDTTTFIYLDIKTSGGKDGIRTLLREIDDLHDKYPALKIQWVLTGSGPKAYGPYLRKHPEEGKRVALDLGLTKASKGKHYPPAGFNPPREQLNIDVTDDHPYPFSPHASVLGYWLSEKHAREMRHWLMRDPDGKRDSHPARMYTVDKPETISEIMSLIGTARGKGLMDKGRDFYICSNLDPARQLLCLARNYRASKQKGFTRLACKGSAPGISSAVVGDREYVIEAHEDEAGRLSYSSYAVDLLTGQPGWLSQSVSYAEGKHPDIALVEHNSRVYAFETHEEQGKVRVSMFEMDESTGKLRLVARGEPVAGYAPAITATCASGSVYAVVMRHGDDGFNLSIEKWNLEKQREPAIGLYDEPTGFNGDQPSVCACFEGSTLHVVEAHTDTGKLWTSWFDFDDGGKLLDRSAKCVNYDDGDSPSIALALNKDMAGEQRVVVMEAHRGKGNNLCYTLGSLKRWQSLKGKTAGVSDVPAPFVYGDYSEGVAPSVSLASSPKYGAVMVEAHESGSEIILDSWWISPWMQRLP